MTGNETLLVRLVENLVENAIRHNVIGGYLHVRTEVDRDRARLVVENSGAIVEEEDPNVLLQHFRRRGTARTGSENGFGLGLSIVAAIADTHGGAVELQPIDDGRLQVIVELALADQELVGAYPVRSRPSSEPPREGARRRGLEAPRGRRRRRAPGPGDGRRRRLRRAGGGDQARRQRIPRRRPRPRSSRCPRGLSLSHDRRARSPSDGADADRGGRSG